MPIKQKIKKYTLFLHNSPFSVCFLAYLITYLCSWLIPIPWVKTFMKTGNYYVYTFCFALMSVGLFGLILKHEANLFSSFKKNMAIGLLIGYLSGIFAYLGMSMTVSAGISRLVHSVQMPGFFLWLLWTPILLCGWLFGMLMAIVVKFIKERNPGNTRGIRGQESQESGKIPGSTRKC